MFDLYVEDAKADIKKRKWSNFTLQAKIEDYAKRGRDKAMIKACYDAYVHNNTRIRKLEAYIDFMAKSKKEAEGNAIYNPLTSELTAYVSGYYEGKAND